MRHRPLPLILFSILFAAAIGASNAQQTLFQQVREENGLSNNIVNCLLKDRNGFMWIGTFDGLSRFDGTHFTTFRNDRHQPASIHQNTVHDICMDNNGDIWCATVTGISVFHQQTRSFEIFFPETKQGNVSYSDIVCDPSGTIWCSGNLGVYKYVAATKSFIAYNTKSPHQQSLSSNYVFKRGLAISPDKRSLWIATQKGINVLDLASNTVSNYQKNPKALQVFDSLAHYPVTFDRTGKLLYGSEQQKLLLQYDLTANKITSLDILFSSKIRSAAPPACIFVDRNNHYWISTWGYAAFLYDPATKQVQEFFQDKNIPYSISGNFFWDAFEDEEGTVWLGTINGLSYTNAAMTAYRLHQPLKDIDDGLASTAINKYYADKYGRWWFNCYDKYQLYRYDPSMGSTTVVDPGTSYGIWGMTGFRNHLVLNTTTGIHTINLVTGRPENLPALNGVQKITGNEQVYWLDILNDSIVCMLTKGMGMVQYDLRSSETRNVSLESNGFLKRNFWNIQHCMLSRSGAVYLAITPLKIARYDISQNRIDSLPISIDKNIRLLEGPVMDITEDAAGNLWITLKETGLIFYDIKTRQTKVWQQSDGLAFNHVYKSVFDRYGKLWIAAYNKYSVYDTARNSFENFSLPIGESNYNYSSKLLALPNGNILGNIDRVFVEWLPDKLKENRTVMPVLISKFLVRDSVLVAGNNIRLHHSDNSFSIEFGVLTALEKNRYKLQYKLEGFDDKWKTAGPLNTAVYTNVPEKKFVFKVRAVSPDDKWTGKETTLSLTVVPPFYRAVWFRILAALLLAMLIGWLIRLRIDSVRRKEKEKNDFNKLLNEWRLKALRSQMNPHFIFNCMNSIDLYILKNDAENASRYLNKFARLVRLILNQSDEMYVSLGKEIEMLRYYMELEKLRFDQPFEHVLYIDPAIDIEETEIPSMLLQPYVENAILHGLRHKKGTGHLSIAIHKKESELLCIIEDDGIGREQAAAINASRNYDSKASILTADRLAILDTKKTKPVVHTIDLKTKDGIANGTRVEINIPVDFDQ